MVALLLDNVIIILILLPSTSKMFALPYLVKENCLASRVIRVNLLLIRLLKFLIAWLAENWLLDDPRPTPLCKNAIDPLHEDHDPVLGLKQKEDMDESPYDFGQEPGQLQFP